MVDDFYHQEKAKQLKIKLMLTIVYTVDINEVNTVLPQLCCGSYGDFQRAGQDRQLTTDTKIRFIVTKKQEVMARQR